MEPDDLRAVSEDLEFLKSDWGKSISDAEARRGSAVLRRLLVEDKYGQAWRAVGLHGEPRVIAVDMQNVIQNIAVSDIRLALAGGISVDGVSIAALTILNKDQEPAAPISDPITTNGFPGEREFSLSEYLRSVAGIAQGHTATRRDVIKYFANIKGGVHLGRSKKKEEEKLIARMEKFEKRVSLIKKDGLLCELIAIGHAVGRSPDTERFLDKVSAAPAGHEAGDRNPR